MNVQPKRGVHTACRCVSVAAGCMYRYSRGGVYVQPGNVPHCFEALSSLKFLLLALCKLQRLERNVDGACCISLSENLFFTFLREEKKPLFLDFSGSCFPTSTVLV